MKTFDAFTNSTSTKNHESPLGEAGLLGEPLHYLGGKKYDNFMRKTWEKPNEWLSSAIKKHDKVDRKINPFHKWMDSTKIGGKIKDFVHAKPADSAAIILGSIFGGGALLGGGGAGGGGGATGGDLGIFSNGGVNGMQGVGGGNMGNLVAQQGGAAGGAASGSANSWQDQLQQMPQQQQQQAMPAPTPRPGYTAVELPPNTGVGESPGPIRYRKALVRAMG